MNFFDKKAIIDSNIISFDIFDTLLVRACNRPEDVFTMVAYNCPDQIRVTPDKFREKRIKAAEEAKRNSVNGEPTLDDIYRYLEDYNQKDKDIIKQEELAIEEKILSVNPQICEIYNECIKKKKHIIAISDMYLSSAFLMKVLRENGFDEIEKVFVSCEYGCNKREGSLFERAIEELHEKPDRILHIGDTWINDYLSPIKHGWKARHISREKVQNMSLPEALIEKTVKFKTGSYFYKVGFSVLGPLLLGFCYWLKKQLRSVNATSVLFFSRDGKIIKEAYDLLFPEADLPKSYFHISRRAINTATLWQHAEFIQLKDFIETTYTITIDVFLQRIGLDPVEIVLPEDYDRSKEYRTADFWECSSIHDLYEKQIKSKAIDHSKEQYAIFAQYLKKNVQGENLAIVDIGWRGSMQDRLEELLQTMEDMSVKTVHGYYLGIEREVPNKHGYLYQTTGQTPRKTIIDAGVGLMETLFLAREGTTIGYKKTDKGPVPVLAEHEITDRETLVNLLQIHQGALDFIERMSAFRIFEKEEVSADICLMNFEKLCMMPSKKDISSLATIQFNDTRNHPLIEKKRKRYYIQHPGELKTDYHNAPWKIGFLKMNGSQLINWKSLYMFEKKGR